MTDFGKLVKALEGYGYCGVCAGPVDIDGASTANKALPLARQLIEERRYDKTVINNLNNRLSKESEENERLKGRETVWGEMEQRHAETLARLTAAEERGEFVTRDRDAWREQAVASEARVAEVEQSNKRAEEVVEAAKEHMASHGVHGVWKDVDDLRDALRRYQGA